MLTKPVINKNYLLAVATVILLIVCYQFAFKKTITAYQLNKRLSRQIGNRSMLLQPQYLARQNEALTSMLKRFSADTVSYRNKVTTEIAELAEKEKATVTEVPAGNITYSNKLTLQKIILKGTFPALLKTLYKCEAQKRIGYIRSVTIKKGKVPITINNNGEATMELFAEAVKQ